MHEDGLQKGRCMKTDVTAIVSVVRPFRFYGKFCPYTRSMTSPLPRAVCHSLVGMASPPAVQRLLSECFRSSDERVVEAAVCLRTARKKIKALDRRRRIRIDSGSTTLETPRLKQVAALIYELSRNADWGVMYVRMYQSRHWTRSDRLPRVVTAAVVHEWLDDYRGNAAFETARTQLCGAQREKADTFLIESLMYDYVMEQSRKGCTVPSKTLVAKYISSWQMRPRCAHIDHCLNRLHNNHNCLTRWCRTFRRNWGLRWGVLAQPTELTQREIQDKVGHLCKLHALVMSWLISVFHAVSGRQQSQSNVEFDKPDSMGKSL